VDINLKYVKKPFPFKIKGIRQSRPAFLESGKVETFFFNRFQRISFILFLLPDAKIRERAGPVLIPPAESNPHRGCANGKIDGWRIAFVDITRQKEMDEELRKARSELELRVRERTAELEDAYRELQTANDCPVAVFAR
jgi:hypothetical protein